MDSEGGVVSIPKEVKELNEYLIANGVYPVYKVAKREPLVALYSLGATNAYRIELVDVADSEFAAEMKVKIHTFKDIQEDSTYYLAHDSESLGKLNFYEQSLSDLLFLIG